MVLTLVGSGGRHTAAAAASLFNFPKWKGGEFQIIFTAHQQYIKARLQKSINTQGAGGL